MSTDVSRQITGQQILCQDCKTPVHFAMGQVSASCTKCGNIIFLEALSKEQVQGSMLSQNWVSKLADRALARGSIPAKRDYLTEFQKPVDVALVQEAIIRYQVEWQMWATLVRDFSNPNLHSAYLTMVMQTKALSMASVRYSEHRRIMSSMRDDQWQAAIADLMLERISQLAIMIGDSLLGDLSKRRQLPKFLDHPAWKAFWFMTGILLFGALTIKYFR